MHLWYKQKFGIPLSKTRFDRGGDNVLASWYGSVGRPVPHGAHVPDGDWKVFAPGGFTDILNLTVRPNSVSGTRAAYEKKKRGSAYL
ncbi:hypothetical protein DHEL01_v208757 [Diaporthe helianthi]|uniref:Uncharacterized protein n=1 Tax=Diaporthe helianthi TaxID=158607 RepID=A0A2P5HRL7_DIAHE|nr:hypothetical protein DHEL01_v208757 [Diaporthe helianthi]